GRAWTRSVARVWPADLGAGHLGGVPLQPLTWSRGAHVSKARNGCCGSPEHTINRRLFLQGGVATALGVSLAGGEAPLDSLWADELRRQEKRVLLLWLAGGSSQLETWDPKPGRPTGGPFRAIPTAVPGVHICELMPQMARV